MSEELKEVGVIVCKSEDISWADCAKPCPEEPPAGFCARMAELEAERDALKAKLEKAEKALREVDAAADGEDLGPDMTVACDSVAEFLGTQSGQVIERVEGKP